MKLTVIGRWGGYPEQGEATSGYLLEHDGFSLLLECGSGVMSSLEKITDTGKLDAVLITHYHHDHFCDIGPLQYARLVKTQLGLIDKMLPIYAPKDNMYFPVMTLDPYTKGFEYSAVDNLKLGPFDITFTENIHPLQSFGARISCAGSVLGFTSDTSVYDKLCEFFYNTDVLMCECSFYKDMDGTSAGHINSMEAGILAESSKSVKLMLTHLPHFGNIDDLALQAAEYCSCPVEIAQYMKQYEI